MISDIFTSARKAGTDRRLVARDLAWSFTFPQQSRQLAAKGSQAPMNGLWAAFCRRILPVGRAFAAARAQGQVRLAGQAQDFSDLFWALSLPAARLTVADVSDRGGDLSCR